MEKEEKKTEEKVEAAPSEKEEVAKPEPREVELAGKKFDISTKEGLIQAQTWAEAMSTMVGRQGQELGTLRKFKTEMAPTESQEKLLGEIQNLRDNGEHGRADELLLAYTRKAQSAAKQELQVEKEKDRFLRSYLKEHKDILDIYDEDDFRTLTESMFDFRSGVSFEDLNSYWLPKVKNKKSFMQAEPVETPQTTVQSQGGRAPADGPSKEETKTAPKVPSVYDVLDEFDPYKRR